MERNRKERLSRSGEKGNHLLSEEKVFLFSSNRRKRKRRVPFYSLARSLARSVTMASKKSRTIHEDAREKVFFLRSIFPRRFSFFFFFCLSFLLSNVCYDCRAIFIYIYVTSWRIKTRMNAEIGCNGEVSMNLISYIYLRGIIVYNLLHHWYRFNV